MGLLVRILRRRIFIVVHALVADLVLEFVEGGDLFSKIKELGSLSTPLVYFNMKLTPAQKNQWQYT
jgi:hypothetical protein